MRIVRLSLGIAALGLLLATTLPAGAATFTVDSTADIADATPGDTACATAAGTCTLRAAVMEANTLPGLDVVTLPGGIFRLTPTGDAEDLALTGDLDVLDSLIVAGTGSDDTIIDGFGADRIFDVFGPIAFDLSEATLKRGSAGGSEGGAIRHAGPGPLTVTNVRFERNLANVGAAIRHSDGVLTITGSDFSANVAGWPGGAVNKTGPGALVIDASSFTANTGDGAGGAVAFDGSDFVGISNSDFIANSGYSGGSVAVNAALGFAMANCRIEDSQSSGNGGAVSYTGPGDATFTGLTVTGALAGGAGGAIYVDSDANLAVTSSTFTDNAAGYAGGALYYYSETGGLTLHDDTFEGNGAFGGSGGGFQAQAGGALDLANLKVRGNVADSGGGGAVVYNFVSGSMVGLRFLDNVTGGGSGGGFYAYVAGAATVADSTFSGNRTEDGDGGGLYLTGDGPFEVHRTTFASDAAGGVEGSGGGLFLGSGQQALILNCTFSGNAAGDEGGGLYGAADTKVWSTTFANNYTGTAGGAIYNSWAIRIANSIIAASSNGGNCAGNEFDSGNRNIDTDGTCELDGPSDQEGIDPQLAPLADNGGPSPTHAITPTSPAIDSGNGSICPEVDQRGLTRPADGNNDGNPICDIGAYEFFDQCPGDSQKVDPGACGCGNVETDDNGNGIIDCLVNAEVKVRIARAQTILDSLDGERSAEERARRADLKGVASGLAQYVLDHLGGLVLTDPSANPRKLMKGVRKAVRGVLRARGGQLDGARTKAEAALDTFDQVLAAD
jgi:CSLREA domain-containing protein